MSSMSRSDPAAPIPYSPEPGMEGSRPRGMEAPKMNESTLQRQLRRLHACDEAIEWCHFWRLNAAWAACERADWLLWLLGTMAGTAGWPSHAEVTLIACEVSEIRVGRSADERSGIHCARMWAQLTIAGTPTTKVGLVTAAAVLRAAPGWVREGGREIADRIRTRVEHIPELP